MSVLAHSPFSVAGSVLAPVGYERKDFQPVISAERNISIGTGAILGTAVQLVKGAGLVNALLIGGTANGFRFRIQYKLEPGDEYGGDGH